MLEKEKELLELSDIPPPNDAKIRQHDHFGKLFDATPIPDHVDGFELIDGESVREVWPEGTDVAKEVSLTAHTKYSCLTDSCLTVSYIPRRGNSNCRSFRL